MAIAPEGSFIFNSVAVRFRICCVVVTPLMMVVIELALLVYVPGVVDRAQGVGLLL